MDDPKKYYPKDSSSFDEQLRRNATPTGNNESGEKPLKGILKNSKIVR